MRRNFHRRFRASSPWVVCSFSCFHIDLPDHLAAFVGLASKLGIFSLIILTLLLATRPLHYLFHHRHHRYLHRHARYQLVLALSHSIWHMSASRSRCGFFSSNSGDASLARAMMSMSMTKKVDCWKLIHQKIQKNLSQNPAARVPQTPCRSFRRLPQILSPLKRSMKLCRISSRPNMDHLPLLQQRLLHHQHRPVQIHRQPLIFQSQHLSHPQLPRPRHVVVRSPSLLDSFLPLLKFLNLISQPRASTFARSMPYLHTRLLCRHL